MDKLDIFLTKKLIEKGSYDFYDFYKDFWDVVDPHPFVDGGIVRFLCETFQFMCRQWIGYKKPEVDLSEIKNKTDVNIIDFRDSDKTRMSISLPPRHSKSQIFNVFGPVWLWATKPIAAVSISHTYDLAKTMNEKRYAIVNSPLFKSLYNINIVANTKDSIKDDRGGQLYSQARDSLTGFGGDMIINDDLTNANTVARDKQEMNNAWMYYQNTMPSRINDIKHSCIFNIQQRLGINDIVGHIMKEKSLREQYIFVTLQAIFEKETYIVCPISATILHYKKGDPLWRERFNDYKSLKAELGGDFETQYQQKPRSSEQAIVSDDMILVKPQIECPKIENADMIFASHDFPIKDKETSDYLGSVLGYRVGNTLYIKDCLEVRQNFPSSIQYVKALSNIWQGIIQVIEDKANGSPILQQLQGEIVGLQSYNVGTNSKATRLANATKYMSTKNVVFVASEFDKIYSKWELSENLNNLVDRLLSFPMVEHDDIVDAFDMLVNFVFLDQANSVYARSFNDENIIPIQDLPKYEKEYGSVFFNKEGDLWKATKIKIVYDELSYLVVTDETQFVANAINGLKKLKEFAPEENIFIDCSESQSMAEVYKDDLTVERYQIDDFDKSVLDLNLAFSNKLVLIGNNCKLTKIDIEMFKRAKTKDLDNQKYITEKDGFVACLRTALLYFGGII